MTSRPEEAERHRQRVKRRYHLTLKSLEESRQLVAQLTLRHRSALKRQRSLLAETQNSSPSESHEEALQRYVEATCCVNELIKAKHKLQQDVELRQKSTQRLWNLLHEQEDSTDQVRSRKCCPRRVATPSHVIYWAAGASRSFNGRACFAVLHCGLVVRR